MVTGSRVALRRRWAATVAALITAGGVLAGGGNASADENVVYAGAGDAPHISVIGDSTLAGVRWYADYGALERFNFVLNAESCRRTIELSCISREGYRSQNVIGAMQTLDGQLGRVVVIMSGYNDPIVTIDDAIAGVVDEARGQGAEHVVWLTLRTSGDVDYSDPQEQSSIATFREYNEQLVDAAAASDGFLQVADWATYSLGASGWFERDGVHLTPAGVDAVTTYIASVAARVLAGEDVSPAEAPWTVLVPGAEGDIVTAVQQAIADAGIDLAGGADGLYGNDTMFAVAEFQRQAGDLQVTGAVDIATARALGVFDDADDDTSPEADPTVQEPIPTVLQPAESAAVEPVADGVDGQRSGDAGSIPIWPIISVLTAGLIAAVVLRRRHVVARRAARRSERRQAATARPSSDAMVSDERDRCSRSVDRAPSRE